MPDFNTLFDSWYNILFILEFKRINKFKLNFARVSSECGMFNRFEIFVIENRCVKQQCNSEVRDFDHHNRIVTKSFQKNYIWRILIHEAFGPKFGFYYLNFASSIIVFQNVFKSLTIINIDAIQSSLSKNQSEQSLLKNDFRMESKWDVL